MAISTCDQIIRELARLRMWRDVTGDESLDATTSAHARINDLLDILYPESRHSHVSTTVESQKRGHPAAL